MNLPAWLASLDPTLLNAATFGLLTLEGAGVPGVPGVIPMLAQSAMIDAGRTTLDEFVALAGPEVLHVAKQLTDAARHSAGAIGVGSLCRGRG